MIVSESYSEDPTGNPTYTFYWIAGTVLVAIIAAVTAALVWVIV